jgi:hypothetical protein
LKPGEIDPNPETKPARPDPKDMDEDGKKYYCSIFCFLCSSVGLVWKMEEAVCACMHICVKEVVNMKYK